MTVIIVTGASRGLGAATARIVARLGANVVINARSANSLETLAQEITGDGGSALVVAGDVSQPHVSQRIVDLTINKFGRIDGLVNNAAVLEPLAPVASADPDEWQRNLEVNVLGPVLLTSAALPYLRQSNGRVINVSSGAAVNQIAGAAAYCAAKAALNQFTNVLAAEESGITTVAVRPGVIETGMQELIREKGKKAMPKNVHDRFVGYYKNKELLPPEAPGEALAVLALHAPNKWSGSFISWNDEPVQTLVRRYGRETKGG